MEEVYENISFMVGDGSRVSFWGHRWCGNNTLRVCWVQGIRGITHPEINFR